MQRVLVSAGLVGLVSFLAFCNSAKKTVAAPEPKSPAFTWTANIKPLMTQQCGPCHVEGKGNKLPMDNIDNVKNNIDEIIRRVELHPGERGFMPFKRARLSDSTINMIKTWKTEGLL